MKVKSLTHSTTLRTVVLVALASVGGYMVINMASAATIAVPTEAEAGVRTNGAGAVADANASGGAAVQFTAPSQPGNLTNADLTNIAHYKIFFGHQSVGANIEQGIGEYYAATGVTGMNMISYTSIPGQTGGFLADTYVGANGDPAGKITDFNNKFRASVGNQVGIAFFKFCFVDIYSGVNITTLFNQYKTTMASLAADYPNVKFFYVTNPLTTSNPADNVNREKFNALMRQEYAATGRLFDIAKIESTAPDGSRVSGTYNGEIYYQMYADYSSDGGHLSPIGRQVVAKALLTQIADTIR